MGSKSSKKLIENKIDAITISGSIENIEFNKVDRLAKKQASNLSNGFASEISDLIIDDVLTTSDSDSISSSENETNAKLSRNESNLSENSSRNNSNREKIKVVRFSDKVMVISTSELNKFSLDRDYKNGKNYQIVKIYYVDLNDGKYTKGKKNIKFEPRINNSESREKFQRIQPSPRFDSGPRLDENNNLNHNISNNQADFDQLRSWNMKKENTFYGLEVN